MAPLAGSAQTSTGSISGNVRDQSESAVPNAVVRLRNLGTNESRSVVSNSLGYYSFQLLPPATYSIEAAGAGFKTFTRENVKLDVDAALVVDIDLQVGATTENITVTDTAPPLDSITSSLGQVMENKRLADLPTDGRNSYGFAALVPGVRAPYLFTQVAYASYNDQFISINGSRVNANQFFFDGGANSASLSNGPGIFPSIDSLQEYKVQTNNFSAEFGNTAGGVINVISKSGTNRPHGSLYDYVRNDKLEANNFFANAAGVPIAPLRFNQFGGSLGGPIYIPKVYNGRDRTFFFFSYEGLRWVRSLTASGTMPTALQRAGDFTQTFNSAGAQVVIYDPQTTVPNPAAPGQYVRSPFPNNKIPGNRMDPVALALLKYFPLPDAPGAPFTRTNNYAASNSALTQKDTFSIRIDQSITNNQKIFFRYTPNTTSVHRPLVYGAQYGPGNPINGNDRLHQQQATLNYSWVITPTTVLELSSSALHYFQGRVGYGANWDPVQLGFPSYLEQLSRIGLCFPAVTATGYGVTINVPDNGGGFIGFGCNNFGISNDTFHEYGNVTKVQGTHSIKFGASMGMNRWTQRVKSSGGGYNFGTNFTQGPNPLTPSSTAGNSMASLLLGTGTSGSINSDVPGEFISLKYYGAYFQDDWKVTSRLTLNLGIRYDYNSPWREKHDRINSWDGTSLSTIPGTNVTVRGGLEFPGVNGLPRGEYNPDRTNFGPRLGFAYSIGSKTVVRGGMGMFYAPAGGTGFTCGACVATTGFAASTTWVTSVDGVTPATYLSNPFPNGFQRAPGSSQGLLTLLGQSLNTMDRNRQTAYSEQWNVTFQRVLPKSLSLELAYAGSHGVHLQGPLNYDQLPDQYLSLGNALLTLMPNPFYGAVTTGPLAAPTVQQGQLLRYFPQFSGLTTVDSYGNSVYHALQTKLERRFSSGLSLLVSYTFSKLLDDVLASPANLGFPGESFSNAGVQDNDNRRLDRSVASFDTPHTFAANGNFELPFGKGKHFLANGRLANALVGGWQINGIATVHSGAPLGLTTAPNTLNNYGNPQRPSYTGAPMTGSGPISQRLNQYFNTAAFAVPPLFTYGNTPRLIPWLRAPGAANLDLSLFKNISVREQMRVQFRCEAFNVFNRPQFDFPGTTIGAPNAGVISNQANNPRDIQLALKFLF